MTTKDWFEHHMNLSSAFLEMALRYFHNNPELHERYYRKHLEQVDVLEKYRVAMVPKARISGK